MIWRHTWSLWILHFAWNLSIYFNSQIAHQVCDLENNIMAQSHYEIIIFQTNFVIPLLWVITSDLWVKSFLIIFFFQLAILHIIPQVLVQLFCMKSHKKHRWEQLQNTRPTIYLIWKTALTRSPSVMSFYAGPAVPHSESRQILKI